MSSADPDSNQGPKVISFSTVLRSTNWAIGGCVLWRLFDHFSSKNLVHEVKKTDRTFDKGFSWFIKKKFFCFFLLFLIICSNYKWKLFWIFKKWPSKMFVNYCFEENFFMPSPDRASNQGPRDISFSTVLRSSNWAIGGCLFVSRFYFFQFLFDHLSFKTLTTRKRKHTESFIKVFHYSMKFFFALFYDLFTLMEKFNLNFQTKFLQC